MSPNIVTILFNFLQFHSFGPKSFLLCSWIYSIKKKQNNFLFLLLWGIMFYLLDADGLAQLTEDDLGGVDAMQNLTRDAALTNVISLSKDFSLHSAQLSMGRPGLLFAATDGCFGYLSTPMEFEYLLLKTLQEAQNAVSWEKALVQEIGEVAGDDYTISGLAMGFGSFENLKRQLSARTALVYRTYIHGLDNCSREEKQKLWEHYRVHYQRLITGVE